MKTKIFALIISILCLSLIFVACDDEKCETHVDENTDGACDVCGETIEKESETESETKPACETHVDEDANKICDACGLAIVTVVEQIPPEDESRVDMVVNESPSDAVVGDYLNTVLPEKEFASEAKKLDGLVDVNGKYAYVVRDSSQPNSVTPALDDMLKVYEIVDLETNETIWTKTELYLENNTKHTTYLATMSEYWYKVVTTVTVGLNVTTTTEYFTYANEKLGTEIGRAHV